MEFAGRKFEVRKEGEIAELDSDVCLPVFRWTPVFPYSHSRLDLRIWMRAHVDEMVERVEKDVLILFDKVDVVGPSFGQGFNALPPVEFYLNQENRLWHVDYSGGAPIRALVLANGHGGVRGATAFSLGSSVMRLMFDARSMLKPDVIRSVSSSPDNIECMARIYDRFDAGDLEVAFSELSNFQFDLYYAPSTFPKDRCADPDPDLYAYLKTFYGYVDDRLPEECRLLASWRDRPHQGLLSSNRFAMNDGITLIHRGMTCSDSSSHAMLMRAPIVEGRGHCSSRFQFDLDCSPI